jgi:hypothetical protein
MKLTKQQLKQIIKEELEVVLSDAEAREFFGDGIPKQISEDKGKVTVITTKRVPRAGGGDTGTEPTDWKYPVGSKELKDLGLNPPGGTTWRIDYDEDNKKIEGPYPVDPVTRKRI